MSGFASPRGSFLPLLCCAALFLHAISVLGAWNRERLAAFVSSMGLPREMQLLHRWKDYYHYTSFIAAHTPPDSLIILPPQAAPFPRIGNRGLTDYFVFPRRTAHEGSPDLVTHTGPIYRVRMPGFTTSSPALPSFLPAAESAPELTFDADFALVQVRERWGALPAHARDFVTDVNGFGGVMFALGKLGMLVLSGVYPTARWVAPYTWPGFFAAAFLLGSLFSTLLFVLLGFLQTPVTEPWQLLFLGVLSAPAFVVRRRQMLPLPRPRAGACPLTMLSRFLVMALFAVLLVKSSMTPILDWDGCAIWGVKARAIFATHGLQAMRFWGAWPEYPPLIPVVMSQLAVGGEALTKLLFPVFAMCLYAVLYEALALARLPEWLRIIAPTLLLVTPLFFDHALMAYVNLPLAVYFTWLCLLQAQWLRRPRSGAELAVALAGCGVVLTRPDGDVYIAYALILAMAWRVWRGRDEVRLRCFCIPLGVSLLWKVFYTSFLKNAETSSLFGIASQGQLLVKLILTMPLELPALFESARYLVHNILTPAHWGMGPLCFLLLLIARPRTLWRRYSLELGFLGLGVSGLAVLSFYLGPRWGNDYYFNVTFIRLYMTLVPLVYLVLFHELARRATCWQSRAAVARL